MKITATITQRHMEQGRNSVELCPVALALKDVGLKKVQVIRAGRRWYARFGKWTTRLPIPARKVAVAFDLDRDVPLPVTFTIDTDKDWVSKAA